MSELQGGAARYLDGDALLEGYFVAGGPTGELPGVLVVPSWLNVVQSICLRADDLAGRGYAVLVADLFGAGVRPRPPQSPADVVAPVLSDRLGFRRRLLAGVRALQGRPECDADRIAAVGYCLGGCGVLELARAGAPLRGVVAVHAMLDTSLPAAPDSVKPKILVLHGDEDPLAPFEALAGFRREMRTARANWEINLYGHARHSFTGEGLLDAGSPEAKRHPQSDSRSSVATFRFLDEVLRL